MYACYVKVHVNTKVIYLNTIRIVERIRVRRQRRHTVRRQRRHRVRRRKIALVRIVEEMYVVRRSSKKKKGSQKNNVDCSETHQKQKESQEESCNRNKKQKVHVARQNDVQGCDSQKKENSTPDTLQVEAPMETIDSSSDEDDRQLGACKVCEGICYDSA